MMKIHLARTTDLDFELFNNVLDILKSQNGKLEFTSNPENVRSLEDIETIDPFNWKNFRKQKLLTLDEINTYYGSQEISKSWYSNLEFPSQIKLVSWNDIFKQCEEIRKINSLANHEILCLLMGQVNDKNWFYAWDTTGNLNFFVDSGHWEFFIPCDARFPIAYSIAAGILQRLMFSNMQEKVLGLHMKPIGCINDFCQVKKDITLKMRTADICPSCIKIIEEKKIDIHIVDQILRTIDSIRGQMLFRERFKLTLKPSRIEIKGQNMQIHFKEMSDTELRLTPLEKTLYIFYLKHPEGVALTHLSNHQDEIIEIYKQIKESYTVAEFKYSINQLLDPTENSTIEKISKIKRKIINMVGDELGEQYLISGQRGDVKRILLDRSFVIWS